MDDYWIKINIFAPIILIYIIIDATRERQVQISFNFKLINEQLHKVKLLTDEKIVTLSLLHNEFRHNVEEMSANEYRKEMEHFGVVTPCMQTVAHRQ